jgi:tetratricopeptide (TPR) repeat protein
MTALQWTLLAAVVLPALAFALWPLWRRTRETLAPGGSPDDRLLELGEEKAAVLRALKELDFDREAGHLSEDDYRALRERYETKAAAVLAALDALRPVAPPARPGAERAPATPSARGWTRHPATLTAGAVALLAFGALIGVNASRFTEPADTMASAAGGPSMPAPTMPGSLLPGSPMPGGPAPGAPGGGADASASLPPQVLAGMLQAARQALAEGRYPEAISAYQAVLKRDAKNVDAMTHLGLIVAIGGHADAALESFDKALAIDPRYAPAYLYRGQVLYEAKQDTPGAIRAWQRFLELVPGGPDHERVATLVKEALSKQGGR